MASYYFNSSSNESSSSQWNKYLQQREFSNDIKSAIDSQTKSFQAEFQAASSIVGSAISQAADVIVGSMDEGFGELSSRLSDVNASIERIGLMLDWRLSVLVDQQRISNLLLGDIAILLRIPDVQKERQYHIEQGFKHYKNAALDPDFYQDALENLLEAEKREKTDYIVLHRIGMIYLYASSLIDLTKAEEYFRRAAKYSVVESDPKAARVFNVLNSTTSGLADQSASASTIKSIAAASYLQAGVACYVQGRFVDAIELSNKAFSLAPTILEAGFMNAKALAAIGDEAEASNVVEGIIKTERFYAVKTAADPDLASKSKVQALLSRLRDDAIDKAKRRIARCREALQPDSQAAPLLAELDQLVHQNSYLAALSALDGLTRIRNWKVPAFAKKYARTITEVQAKAERLAQSTDRLERRQYEHLKRDAEWKKRQETVRLLKLDSKSIEDFIGIENKLARLVEEESNRQIAIKQHLDETREREREASAARDARREVERQQQEEEARRLEQLQRLLKRAHAEYERQNQKWFGKDFSLALSMYEEAADLGNTEAAVRIAEIKARLK